MDHQTGLNDFEPKLTPPFSWSKYNQSQTKEKTIFLVLLKELCNNIRRESMRHIIFCLCMKVYCTKSARRLMGELELCKRANYIDYVPHFNSIYNYLRNKTLTNYLQELIVLTSLPMKAIEKKFCTDATGFGMSIMDDRWSRIRQQYSKHHKYLKAHITFGVLSNIVTSCRITEGTVNDTVMLPEMVDETAEHFKAEEWTADKGYLSRSNMNAIYKHNCLPFIPFKENITGAKGKGSMIWSMMFHFFNKNRELYMKKYHLRSNAESGIFMIKQRFGDVTPIRNETGAKNDILVKVLCHNLCVLIQEIFLLGIEVDFNKYKEVFRE